MGPGEVWGPGDRIGRIRGGGGGASIEPFGGGGGGASQRAVSTPCPPPPIEPPPTHVCFHAWPQSCGYSQALASALANSLGGGGRGEGGGGDLRTKQSPRC